MKDLKSIKKIDKEIICFGAMLILMVGAFIFFELVTINYRPILIDGELETSYPSTHTLISLCILLSSTLISTRYIHNKAIKNIYNIFCYFVMITAIISRLLSGMHWATDIIGGILLSLLIVSIFNLLIQFTSNKKNA
jgi:undecaprenyl-diphosphatase